MAVSGIFLLVRIGPVLAAAVAAGAVARRDCTALTRIICP
jgi:hypothetical protein